MRVKSLELHGFKSFASTTRFEFGDGLAAVVGPNGSGKSNLVDAIRWVLGEQSYSHLRGKRTEDVIWSGGKSRTQAGMAEVSITLDNSDSTLSLPYAEITITRRAYRSGENEYFLNRSRVRLRDILELTSSIGQGFTVVGQGTADAALSLSAEGRRGMFEEAADITQHNLRRDEAVRRLTDMQTNTDRVQDILAELRPRLGSLARQARQAREREELEAQLRELRVAYYSREIGLADLDLGNLRVTSDSVVSEISRLRSELTEAANKEAELTGSEDLESSAISRLERERDSISARRDEAYRSVLDGQRRVAETDRTLEELQRRLGEAEENHLTAQQEVEAARQAADAAKRETTEIAHRMDSLRQSVANEDSDRDHARQEAASLLERLRDSQRAISGKEAQLDALRERVRSEQEIRERYTRDLRTHEQEVCQAQQKLTELERTLRGLNCTKAHECESLTDLERRIRDGSQRLAELEAERSERSASLREQRARLRLLEDLDRSGSGFNRAVQHVLQAARRSELAGVLGTVGTLIDVPQHLERAIESALGGTLQNVVVNTWKDAEAAIAYLKRSGAGRVTFLPLDTLRPGKTPARPPGEDVLGLAKDLISHAPELERAIRYVLGRTLVVRELATARSLVGNTSGVSTIVTLAGETVRPGGALTGGSSVRESGVLSRQRELRELPNEIADIERALVALERDSKSELSRKEKLEDESKGYRDLVARMDAEIRRAEQRRYEAAHDHELAVRRVSQVRESEERLGRTQDDSVTNLDQLRAQLAADQERLERLDRQYRNISSDLEASQSQAREREAEIAGLRTEAAVSAERARAEEDRCQRASAQCSRTESTKQTLCEQLRRAEVERRTQERSLESASTEHEKLIRQTEEMESRLSPLRESLKHLREQRDVLRAEQSRLSSKLSDLEERRLGIAIKLQRLEDRRASLAERALHETGQSAFTDGPTPPEDVESRIEKLQHRISRFGSINPLAIQEHEELKSRTGFLERQISDLDKSREDLEHVIDALEEQMRTRFSETFSKVSDRFSENFQALFGGGTARIELAQRDGSVGVEIQAQPPGKRLGSLAQLSGGERSLTSCALLFALIQVSGAPFCVLDEVDAALDENNVDRFCDLLEIASRHTQFIVITHNRGTIERAGRIYGITMEVSGTSKVLSLELEDVPEEKATA